MASENVVVLTKENFDNIIEKSTLPVMVDFWASWCGPCRSMSPIIDSLSEEYKDRIIVAKLNVDEASDIASKMRIVSIPTLIIFKDALSVDKLIGLHSKEDIESMINKQL